jgi:predicted DNA-binding transcriptional regulator YafY
MTWRFARSVPSPRSCALYCQHGSRVEVVWPKELRKSVGQVLERSAESYR